MLRAKELGIGEHLFKGVSKSAWRFLEKYRSEHGGVPGIGIVIEQTGASIREPDEEERADLSYLADQLFRRHEFRCLQHGLSASLEHLEEGEQDDAVTEVHSLADALRQAKIQHVQLTTIAQEARGVQEMYERTKRGEIGVPFPWDAMNDMTLGMWPQTLTFFVARPGVGKCVHEDTEIVDPVTGVPRSIREVYTSDVQRVTTWSKDEGVHPTNITAKVDTGRKECLRFTTRSGRSVVVTPEHPFLTPEGWRRADELEVGRSLALPSEMPFPEQSTRMVPAELDLWAILLSKGSYSGNHVGFTTTDPAILMIACSAAEMIGVDVTPRNEIDYDLVRRGSVGPNPVREILRGAGADRKLARNKVLPEAIFRLPKDQLSRFLSIFWMCDGTVSKRGDALVTLASETMVRQIQSLLLRFGIQSRVQHRPIKGGFDAWRLRVYAHCANAFASAFSLWGQKADRLNVSNPRTRNPNVGSPRISDELVEELRCASKVGSGRWSGGLHAKVAEVLGRARFQTRDLFGNHNAVKMTAFRGFSAVYGIEDQYRWWWDSSIFWDEVVSIENVGEQKVYDLTVDPTACFVANDIIVHNTWTAIIIAMHVWLQGIIKETHDKVLIISPEMNRTELAERMVAKHGGLSYGDLVAGTLGMMGEPALEETITKLEEIGENLYILDDEDRLQPEYIEAAIDALKPKLVVFDAVYLMRVDEGKVKKGPGSKGGRYDRIHETVDWMRRLSRRKNIPILGISQLSREGKVKKGARHSVKQGKGTGGLEDALAFTDTLLMDVHNLFAVWQDPDMRLDKQLMFVPLKVRRRARSSHVVINWDMEQMNFDQIGTKIDSSPDDDDEGGAGSYKGKKQFDEEFSDVPF